jgi:hypothetical protein
MEDAKQIETLIDRVRVGEYVEDIIDEVSGLIEAPVNPFQMRKKIRASAPMLFKFLSDRGDFHDVATVLAAKKKDVKKIMKDHEIPKNLEGELNKLIKSM